MSHQMRVQGNFGSATALKAELKDQNIKFRESKEGGETWLLFEGSHYNQYNPLKICLTKPENSTMDADIRATVQGWYQGASARHVKELCALRGISVISEIKDQSDIVLQVAVG